MNTVTFAYAIQGMFGANTQRYAKVIVHTLQKMELLEAIYQSDVGDSFDADKARVELCVFTKEEALAAFRREATRLVSELVHLHTVLKNATEYPLLDRFYKRDNNKNFLASDGVELFDELRENLNSFVGLRS